MAAALVQSPAVAKRSHKDLAISANGSVVTTGRKLRPRTNPSSGTSSSESSPVSHPTHGINRFGFTADSLHPDLPAPTIHEEMCIRKASGPTSRLLRFCLRIIREPARPGKKNLSTTYYRVVTFFFQSPDNYVRSAPVSRPNDHSGLVFRGAGKLLSGSIFLRAIDAVFRFGFGLRLLLHKCILTPESKKCIAQFARSVTSDVDESSIQRNFSEGSRWIPKCRLRPTAAAVICLRRLIMNYKISRRAAALSPSLTLAIDSKAKQMKAEGQDVIGFGA